MRILGILLIIVALVPIGWGGYVEFVYIGDGKQKFAERMEQAETTFNERIEAADQNYKKQLADLAANASLSQEYKDQVTESAKQTYEQAKKIGQEGFEKGKEMMQAALDKHIADIRDESKSIYALIGGVIVLLFGAFLTFRRKA